MLIDYCLLCVDRYANLFQMQMSHRCLGSELQRFPVLRKRMDEVIGGFLREGLQPAEAMIGHIIEMEVMVFKSHACEFLSP